VVTSDRPHVLRSEFRSRIQQSSASSEGGVDVADVRVGSRGSSAMDGAVRWSANGEWVGDEEQSSDVRFPLSGWGSLIPDSRSRFRFGLGVAASGKRVIKSDRLSRQHMHALHLMSSLID